MSDLHAHAAPYALGSLTERENARFEDHLEVCETCRSEAGGFAATAARLAEAVSLAPPVGLRTRLLAAVRGTPQERPAVSELRRHRGLRRVAPRLAVAATFVVGAAAVGGFAIERDHARDNQLATTSMSAVLAAPDAATAARALSGGGNVRLVSSATRDVAVIAANDLPRPRNHGVYQVWMIRGEVAMSQGTFATDGTMIMRRLDRADRVAVTVEPAGGSAMPTTLPVVSLPV